MTSVHNTKIGQDTRIYNGPYAPHYCRKSLKRKNLWSFLFFRVLVAGLSIALNQFGSVRAIYMPNKSNLTNMWEGEKKNPSGVMFFERTRFSYITDL